MPTYNNTFAINGVIDTSKTVLQNLTEICNAAGAWLSYDIAQGKWAVAINQAGSSVASFDDSNIIGGINISSTGLTELYNSVEIEYPHKDLKDRKDYITYTIASASRYPNEQDNVLQIQSDLVNNPVQAQLLASRQLKQSRVDKVIEFRTDFSYLGLKAGDLIDVTNTPYGYTNKVFRIVSLQEDDSDEGVLSLSIRALEYDADVYDTSGLIYSEKTIDNGIITKDNNTAVTTSDQSATANNLLSGLGNAALATLMLSLANGFLNKSLPGRSSGATLSQRFYDYSTPSPYFMNVTAYSTSDQNFVNFNSNDEYLLPGTWTVAVSGTYIIESFIRHLAIVGAFDGSGNYVIPELIRKGTGVRLKINGGGLIEPGNLATNMSVSGDPMFSTTSLKGSYNLTAGDSVQFYIVTKTDWAPDHPTGGIADAKSAFFANVQAILAS